MREKEKISMWWQCYRSICTLVFEATINTSHLDIHRILIVSNKYNLVEKYKLNHLDDYLTYYVLFFKNTSILHCYVLIKYCSCKVGSIKNNYYNRCQNFRKIIFQEKNLVTKIILDKNLISSIFQNLFGGGGEE